MVFANDSFPLLKSDDTDTACILYGPGRIHIRNQKWHSLFLSGVAFTADGGKEILLFNYWRTQVLLKKDFQVGCPNWLRFLSGMHARILSTAFWARWPYPWTSPGHLCSMSVSWTQQPVWPWNLHMPGIHLSLSWTKPMCSFLFTHIHILSAEVS